MARYKVRVTVYQDSKGKTLVLPTILGVLGNFCLGLSVMFLLASVALLLRGEFTPLFALYAALRTLIVFLVGYGLKKLTKRKAQEAYLASMDQPVPSQNETP